MMSQTLNRKQEAWNGLQIQNPILCWSMIVVDILVIYSLIEGVFGEYDRHFSFHQYQGYKDGLYQYIFPSLLVQFLLLEVLLDFRDDQQLSFSYLVLMLVDALAILSIFSCVILNVDFGYFHSLAEYLTVQLTSRAVPFLLTQSILFEIVLITAQYIQTFFPEVWVAMNSYYARNADHEDISASNTSVKLSIHSLSSEKTRIHFENLELHVKNVDETSCTENINNISHSNILTEDKSNSLDNSAISDMQSALPRVEVLPSNAHLPSIVQSSSMESSLLSSTDKVLESLYLPSTSLLKDIISVQNTDESPKPETTGYRNAAKSLATRVVRILVSPKRTHIERKRPPLPRKRSFRFCSPPKRYSALYSSVYKNFVPPRIDNGCGRKDLGEMQRSECFLNNNDIESNIISSNIVYDNDKSSVIDTADSIVVHSEQIDSGKLNEPNLSVCMTIETQTDINLSDQMFVRHSDFSTKDVCIETDDILIAQLRIINGILCDAEVQVHADQQNVSNETDVTHTVSVATQVIANNATCDQSADTTGLGTNVAHVESDTHDLLTTHEVGSDSCYMEIMHNINRDIETEINLQDILSLQDKESDTSDLHCLTAQDAAAIVNEEVKRHEEKEIQCISHEVIYYLDQEIQTTDVISFDEVGVQCEQYLRDASTSPVNLASPLFVSPNTSTSISSFSNNTSKDSIVATFVKNTDNSNNNELQEEENETEEGENGREQAVLSLSELEKTENIAKNNNIISLIKQQLFSSSRSLSSSLSSSSQGSMAKEVVREGFVSELVQTFDKSKSPFSSISSSTSNSSEKKRSYADNTCPDSGVKTLSPPLSPSISSLDFNNLNLNDNNVYDSLIICPHMMNGSDHVQNNLPSPQELRITHDGFTSSSIDPNNNSELLQLSGGEVSSPHSNMATEEAPRFATLHLVTLSSTTPVKQASFSFLPDEDSSNELSDNLPQSQTLFPEPSIPTSTNGDDNNDLSVPDVSKSLTKSRSYKKKKSFFDTALATPAETDLESDYNNAPRMLFNDDKSYYKEDTSLNDLFVTAIDENNIISHILSSSDEDIVGNAKLDVWPEQVSEQHSISTIELAREDEEADDEHDEISPTAVETAVSDAAITEINEAIMMDMMDIASVQTQSTAKRSIRSGRSSVSDNTRHTHHTNSSRHSRRSYFSARSNSTRSSNKTVVLDAEEAEDEAQLRRTIQSLHEHHLRLRQRIMLNQQERQLQLMIKKSSYPLLPLSEPFIARNPPDKDDMDNVSDIDSDGASFLSMSSSYFSAADNKHPSDTVDEFAENEESEDNIHTQINSQAPAAAATSVMNELDTWLATLSESKEVVTQSVVDAPGVVTITPTSVMVLSSASSASQSSSPATKTDHSKDVHSTSTSSSLEWLMLQVAALQPKLSPTMKNITTTSNIQKHSDINNISNNNDQIVLDNGIQGDISTTVNTPETCDFAVTLPLNDTTQPCFNYRGNIKKQRQQEHLYVQDTSRLFVLDLDNVFLHLTLTKDYDSNSDIEGDNNTLSFTANSGVTPLLCHLSERLQHEWRASLHRHGRFPLLCLRLHDKQGLRKLRYVHCVPLDNSNNNSNNIELKLELSSVPRVFLYPSYVASLLSENTNDGGENNANVALFLSVLSLRTVRLIAHLLDAEFPLPMENVDVIRHIRDMYLSAATETQQMRHQTLPFLFLTQRSAYHTQIVLRAAETVDGSEQQALEATLSQVKEIAKELPCIKGMVLFTLQEKWPFTNKFGHLFNSPEHTHPVHPDTLFFHQHYTSNNNHTVQHRGSAYVAHRQWQRFQQLYRRKLACKFVAIDSAKVLFNPL